MSDCKCDHMFTCGHCLANAKPWHFTTLTNSEHSALQAKRWRAWVASGSPAGVEWWNDTRVTLWLP